MLRLFTTLSISLLFLLSSPTGDAAKIILLPMFGKSHVFVMDLLSEELIQRGHEVKIVVEKANVLPNMKTPVDIYTVSEPFDEYEVSVKYLRENKLIQGISSILRLQFGHCNDLLNNSRIMKAYLDYDLVISDRMFACNTLFAQAIGKPNVLYSTLGFAYARGILGNPYPLSYAPQMGTTFTSEMNLLQRCINVLVYLIGEIVYRVMFDPMTENLMRKFNISTHLSGADLDYTPSLVLLPVDFALEYPRPVLPNVKIVGPLTPRPASPLPSDLEKFVNESPQVVLVSFGTILDSLSDEKIAILLEAFNKLPYKILWKSKNVDLKTGKNVKIVKWFPQNDLLGHNNVVAFVTHCGHNSMYEAAYHGVPVIGMPVFGDQPDNLQQLLRRGVAVGLNTGNLTVDGVINAIKTVVTDDRYSRKMKELSVVIKSRPRTPLQTAADWIDYVLISNGAKHLRVEKYNLNFIQYYLIDVCFVILSIIYIIFKIFQFICRKCCRRQSKSKKD
ncbi:2-hydroxyacylsphingosine 1-beta-galactosyltransferase [Trichoplax sp. H2]|nr:2-hydroxyacylsphingosine 1-beta-galactosyltransferase [Trichoplax sp. H2]|eukprot:RDD35917.1 2-hydroxyacylsphingosine 1-beta-galactosyltransferase [Trichoplax sp. H2]